LQQLQKNGRREAFEENLQRCMLFNGKRNTRDTSKEVYFRVLLFFYYPDFLKKAAFFIIRFSGFRKFSGLLRFSF